MCIERLRLPSPFGKTKATPLSTLLTKAASLSLPASSGAIHCILQIQLFINHYNYGFITLP
jgi:hypothetical protein